MTKALLYFFPGTCAQVTAVALKETGTDFELVLADFRTPETKQAYREIMPKGKVPALVIDGQALLENPAILWFLDQRTPGALFSLSNDPFEHQRRLSDLVWCGSVIHPMVRQIRMPQLWTAGDPAPVAADGTAKLRQEAADVERRVGPDGWWYRDGWSIVDAYLWWCFRTAQKGNLNLGDFPLLLSYLNRIEQRPSIAAVLAQQKALGVAPLVTSLQTARESHQASE